MALPACLPLSFYIAYIGSSDVIELTKMPILTYNMCKGKNHIFRECVVVSIKSCIF